MLTFEEPPSGNRMAKERWIPDDIWRKVHDARMRGYAWRQIVGSMAKAGYPYASRGRLTTDALRAFKRLGLVYTKKR